MIMMDGKGLSAKIKDELKSEIDGYEKKPILAVITIGDDEASKVYVNNKKKSCEYVGISFLHFDYVSNVKEKEVIEKIEELNNDSGISGIIVQLPLPNKFDTRKIVNTISPLKDVDALTDTSIGKMMSEECVFVPCTPKGIMELLDYYKIDLTGKHVVIVGRSNLVGRPLLQECLKKNATVTICHSKTVDLEKHTTEADVLIVATGKKHLIDKRMIKKDVVIIDVGINREDGKLYGDVNPNVEEICSYLTPVPGGVGPMTVVMLLKNTLTAFKIMNGIKDE